MISKVQIDRLHNEYKDFISFINKHDRLSLIQTAGSPPSFYQVKFNNVRTSITEDRPEHSGTNPRVDIRTVSFDLAINLEETYPLQKPGLSVSPAMAGNGRLCLLYNSHVYLFAVCLFSPWRMSYSLIDVVCRLYNILSYNYNLVNLNDRDVLDRKALEWYKDQIHQNPKQFPFAPAMNNLANASDRVRRFQFVNMVAEE